MSGIYTAYTSTGAQVTLVVSDDRIIAIAQTPYLVTLTDTGYEIRANTPVPLYTIEGNALVRLTNKNFNLKESTSPLFFESPEVLQVKTTDPPGTKRFDDAYRMSSKTYELEDTVNSFARKLTVTICSIIVAVVRPGQLSVGKPDNKFGFKVGVVQSAYLFKYSYIIINGTAAVKKMNIGIGNVVATVNEISKDRISPLTRSLAEFIKMIQPNSKFTKPDISLMFWTICVSRNVEELYRENGIESSGKKHTAPLRDLNACNNLMRLEEILRTTNLTALKF